MTEQQNVRKKSRKKPNPYVRATVWRIIDIIAALLPITVLGIIQRDVYFAKGTGWSNGIGISMLGVFVGLIISKKTSILKGVGGFWFITLILWCLRNIIADMLVISFCATIGYTASVLFTHRKVIKWEKIKDKKETSDINAEALGEVVEKIIARSGRV
jgi:hypothetical protein